MRVIKCNLGASFLRAHYSHLGHHPEYFNFIKHAKVAYFSVKDMLNNKNLHETIMLNYFWALFTALGTIVNPLGAELKCIGTPPSFFTIFAKGNNFCDFLFTSLDN